MKVMNLKFIILLMLLIPVASAVTVEPPVNYAGSTTNITFNYSTVLSEITFYSANNTLVYDGLSHSFSTAGHMDISLNSYLEIDHIGDSGTWLVNDLADGTYDLYVNDVYSNTIQDGTSVSISGENTYKLVPTTDVMLMNVTLWEPLNETCLKFTISNVYEEWYPELSYTVADHTYSLYHDGTGTLITTNSTTSTNQSIIFNTDVLLSAGSYTISQTDSVPTGEPNIVSHTPSTTPTFTIIPSESTVEKTFTITTENDSNIQVQWYEGEKFYSVYGNNENYITTYNYTLVDTDTPVNLTSSYTFNSSEVETKGIIARVINTSTNIYSDQVWNWVIQSPDFAQDMDYTQMNLDTTNTISLTTSNEDISEVTMQILTPEDEYTNMTMTSIYSNYEYGEVINGETSYTYTEIFEEDITPMSEGTYQVVKFFITQNDITYEVDSSLSFVVDADGGTSEYTTTGGGGSSSSKTKLVDKPIEILKVKDGSETFKYTEEHAIYSVSSDVDSFTITVKEDNTNIDAEVYKQIDIESSVSTPSEYEFTFLVDTEWINTHNGNVKLMHYTDNEWVEVPIEIVSQSNDFIKYKANIDSFSPYAIISEDTSIYKSVQNVTKSVPYFNYIIGALIIIVLYSNIKSKKRFTTKKKTKKQKKKTYDEF